MKVKIGGYPKNRWYHNFLYEKFGYENVPKVSVRIDKCDTWSMDHTLAHIVVPMLTQLRQQTHSAPLVCFGDRPQHLIGTVPDPAKGETDEFHHDAWYWAMDEMLFAFESKLTEWTFDDLVFRDQERISNCFRLFGKYYENLWD